MADWLLRHPTVLSLFGVAMVVAAIAFEISDLVTLSGARRVVAVILFVAAVVVSFLGFQAAWERRARSGTLVLDRKEQARVARQSAGPGILISALGLLVVGIVGPGVESPILGMAVGLFSFSLIGRRRLRRLET